MSESWAREEVEATVADYLHMLTMELAGQQYGKTDHRRKLLRLLKSRSEGAIERKHQNISAILIELGCPYISGYKPLRNYQALLYEVIIDRLKGNDLFDRAALAAVQLPAAPPSTENFSNVTVDPPRLSLSAREPDASTRAWRDKTSAAKRDYLAREARNALLGQAGEEFIVNYERWRLTSNRKENLANKVEHVAKTPGDGLGFDVLSYDTTGKERLIEVKTTSFGRETPFFITRNEVDLSRSEADLFHLYRLFQFRKDPRLFSLRGPVDQHCRLDPITFQAHFS
jgi:hypothetical protein